MSRFLLTALFSGAIGIGLATSAHAMTKPAAAVATSAATAPVVSVDYRCGPHHHYVPRHHHHGHTYGGYCAHN